MSDFKPFPEQSISALATYHDDVAKGIQSVFLAGLHTDRATACRSALTAHSELRDRFLEQEMLVRKLKADLDSLLDAVRVRGAA